MSTSTVTDTETSHRGTWIGLALGLLPMAWGVRLYLDSTPDLARCFDVVKWLVGLDLGHDLVFAPLVVGLGLLISRLVPSGLRAPVQVASILTGAVLLVGLLPLLGSSKTENPTIQPIAYGPAVLSVIVAIWLGTAVVTLLARRGRRRA